MFLSEHEDTYYATQVHPFLHQSSHHSLASHAPASAKCNKHE